MIRLQHCTTCGVAQYPPRELCAACLADTLQWREIAGDGEVLAITELHHSHEPSSRSQLPLHVGLVLLDAGPSVVCFVDSGCRAGRRTRLVTREGRLHATAVAPPL